MWTIGGGRSWEGHEKGCEVPELEEEFFKALGAKGGETQTEMSLLT